MGQKRDHGSWIMDHGAVQSLDHVPGIMVPPMVAMMTSGKEARPTRSEAASSCATRRTRGRREVEGEEGMPSEPAESYPHASCRASRPFPEVRRRCLTSHCRLAAQGVDALMTQPCSSWQSAATGRSRSAGPLGGPRVQHAASKDQHAAHAAHGGPQRIASHGIQAASAPHACCHAHLSTLYSSRGECISEHAHAAIRSANQAIGPG